MTCFTVLLLFWYYLYLSRALGRGFDAPSRRLQWCTQLDSPVKRTWISGSLFDNFPREACSSFFISVFLLTQTMSLPSKQNSLTAFKSVLLMIIWNSVESHLCRLMLHDVDLPASSQFLPLCWVCKAGPGPHPPPRSCWEGPRRHMSSAHRSCCMTTAEVVSSAHGWPKWPCVPKIEKWQQPHDQPVCGVSEHCGI